MLASPAPRRSALVTPRNAIAYWDARSTRWRVAPPLSPGPADLRFYEEQAAAAAARSSAPLEALLLGATPSIGAIDWPLRARVRAVDWSAGMFTNVWRGAAAVRCNAVRADWRRLPFAGAALDFAVGDGCYSTFEGLDDVHAVNRELARVLRDGATACVRCFARPARADSLDALFSELAAGRHANLDMFRWLVAMALHPADGRGIDLRRVWEEWHARVPDPEAHPARGLWSADAVANIEGWREARGRYVFPTVRELEAAAAPGFEVAAVDVGPYEWAERFPRLVLRRRDR